MNVTLGRDKRSVLGAAAALAALLFVLLAGAPQRAAAGICENADAGIDEANAAELAEALSCLINDDRADTDRPRLKANGKLREAATRHNKAMRKANCWDHDCPGEPNLERRIRNTGYLNGATRWDYAENFGCANSPQAMLNTWLDRQFSRQLLRKAKYRDIGVAALRDQIGRSNCNDGIEVTFTVVLAQRKP